MHGRALRAADKAAADGKNDTDDLGEPHLRSEEVGHADTVDEAKYACGPAGVS